MLPKSKKRKGKQLEKMVAKELDKIFSYAYSRADSGSGKEHKEDVTLPPEVPLFIECKNHSKEKFSEWWGQLERGCTIGKYPVLIYKLPYKQPQVQMYLNDLIGLMTKQKVTSFGTVKITMPFDGFVFVLKQLFHDKINA